MSDSKDPLPKVVLDLSEETKYLVGEYDAFDRSSRSMLRMLWGSIKDNRLQMEKRLQKLGLLYCGGKGVPGGGVCGEEPGMPKHHDYPSKVACADCSKRFHDLVVPERKKP